MAAGTSNGAPDIGGQAFNVSDPNPPIAFDDLYSVLTTLTATTKFQDLPPVLMLALAQVIEAYYVLRLTHPILSWILPKLKVSAEFVTTPPVPNNNRHVGQNINLATKFI